MEPMKLEDKMKERLKERTITPSVAAWDRIAGKLETQAVVKKSNRKLWLAIAASFIGGVIATLFILNQQPLTQGNDQLVITPDVETVKDIDDKESVLKPTPIVQDKSRFLVDEVAAVEILKEETTLSRKQDKGTQNRQEVVVVKENELIIKEPNKKGKVINDRKHLPVTTVVASSEKLEKEKNDLNTSRDLKNAIDQKLNAIVASVDMNTVSDEEIDALLKDAQREIISNRVFDTKTGRVDANALLLDVEAEVDPRSFRDKVFEALAEGFVKAREAVADRNN